MILPTGPNATPDYAKQIHEILDKMEDPPVGGLAFPYVTNDGLNNLCVYGGSDWRNQCRSRWLVGLNQGITTPAALRELRDCSNTEIRVFLPRGQIDKHTLVRNPFLHAKIAAFISKANQQQREFIITSANATGSAMGTKPDNYEFGARLSFPESLDKQDLKQFRDWWEEVWDHGVKASSSIIDEYEDIRENVSRDPPEAEPESTITESVDATFMWTETGAMQGEKRYLLEIKEELANFFNEKSSSESDIRIEFRDKKWKRKIKYDEGHYSPQWRVYLPMDFSAHNEQYYRYKVARFEKCYDKQGRYYKLEVRESNHSDVEKWRGKSEQLGVKGRTSPGPNGREYGYW